MDESTVIQIIKKKKELQDIADSVVQSVLEEQISKHRISLSGLNEKQVKPIIKSVRAELRLFSGRFQKSLKDRKAMLKENRIEELLQTHSSTKERLSFYPELKKKIASLKVKSILDLGCGLNPIALANKNIKYYASDIKESELSLIKEYFKINKFSGESFIHDLRFKKNLPEADLCLLFKVLDVIDTKNHKNATELIKSIHCKYILVSFATKKLSGKKMNFPRRFWFENLLNSLNLKFETFSTENEFFYLIKKSAK